MKCPGCGAAVEAEQDFCMECGEPIAQAAVVDVPSTAPSAAPPPPATVVSRPAASAPEKSLARPKWKRVEEPEPIRCPRCGIPSRKTRCPGCGVRLRADDD